MPCIKWSTPLRRSGKRNLSLIPNEIYLEILDFIELELDSRLTEREYKKILTNLVLVCRFFCAICLPRIFKSMTFDGEETGQDEGPKSAVFCRQLNKNHGPARLLASYVKACRFKNWLQSSSNPNWAFSAFYKIYIQALPQFTNLDSLSFTNVHITSTHIESIRTLKRLTRLSFDRCTFDKSVHEILIPPSLTSLEFLVDYLPIPKRISGIFIDAVLNSSILNLNTDEDRLIRSVLKHPQKIGLEHLEIAHSIAGLDLLLEYLKHSVSIKHIGIGPGTPRPEVQHSHWRTMSCHGDFPSGILEVYPVDALHIYILSDQGVEMLFDLGRHPSLRNLTFGSFALNFNLVEQKRLISGLTSGPFPSLTYVKIERYVEWRREDNTAPWRPVIPRDFRTPFKAYIEDLNPPSLTDYDCFFENQLSSLGKDEYPRCLLNK